MNPIREAELIETRRHFFSRSATGIGTAALASLLNPDLFAAGNAAPNPNVGSVPVGGLPDVPHFAAKAKRVIYLFQNGAPTHVDLFDWKPELQKRHKEAVPASYIQNRRFSTMTGAADGKLLLAPVEPFSQRGESGAWVSDFMPHTAKVADELCFVKSLHTEQVNHAPAINFNLSGAEMPGRPTLGAWLSYGLGSATDELPSFVVMTSITKNTTCGQIFYDFYWGSGFLPSRFQGVKFRGQGD
ncbi:MAG TPA: sulfatase, partial [Planctomycetaceae bacterium]|nr:sulfatase [Planctomycetaceae bacterium]